LPQRKQPYFADFHVEQDGVPLKAPGAVLPGLAHQGVELAGQQPQGCLDLAGQDLRRRLPSFNRVHHRRASSPGSDGCHLLFY